MKKVQKNKKINSGGYWHKCDHCPFECDSMWEMLCHTLQTHGFKGSDIMGYH